MTPFKPVAEGADDVSWTRNIDYPHVLVFGKTQAPPEHHGCIFRRHDTVENIVAQHLLLHKVCCAISD
jgi:hypothetical protein